MPHSPRTTLLLLTVALSPLLAACDEHTGAQAAEQRRLYGSLDACLAQAADMDAVKACRMSYQQALQDVANAPRYDTQATCEDVYGAGNCVPRGTYVHEGGSGFIPFLFGYTVGHAFGGGPVYSYRPIYVTHYGFSSWSGGPGGSWTTSSSGFSSSASASNWSSSRPASTPAASSVGTVTRGGFGASASAHVSSMGG